MSAQDWIKRGRANTRNAPAHRRVIEAERGDQIILHGKQPM